MRTVFVIASSALLILLACSEPAPSSALPIDGPVARHARTTAALHDVPGDLVLAIAVVERGLMLPAHRTLPDEDDIAIAGILELRRGAFDSLARGAELLSVSEERLQVETDLGTEAGILVLAELGRELFASGEDWPRWAEALYKLSGYRDASLAKGYAAEVFRVLRAGGRFPARDGEEVFIRPHPDVAFELLIAPPSPQTLGTPDHPGAIWFETSCVNKCNTTRNKPIDAIILHSTEGGWHSSVTTLQNGLNKSVHYIIDEDGSRVGQFIPESYMGWHGGNSCWNNRSIGIEHVGYAAKTFDKALYEKSIELVKSIRSRHSIPVDREHVIGHYQVPNPNTIGQCVPACGLALEACIKSKDYGGASAHWDPGYNWQWCQYMEMLGGTCECNDTLSRWSCTTDGTQMWRCAKGNVEKRSCGEPCQTRPAGTDDECAPAVVDEPSDGGGGTSDDEDAGPVSPDGGEASLDAGEEASADDPPEKEPLPWPDAADEAIEARGEEGLSESAMSEGGCCAVAPGREGDGGRGIALAGLALFAWLGRRRRVDVNDDCGNS